MIHVTTGARSPFWAAGMFFALTTACLAQITITEFTVPTATSFPAGIAAGPDGALWFTEQTGNNIGRITTGGAITEYPVPTASSILRFITVGPDGALWFTENSGNKIGRITTAGAITEFIVPTASAGVQGITAGPDGALWFTELSANKIGRVTTGGVFSEFLVPTATSQPYGITTGPDGALWFTELGSNKIGRVTTAGAFTEFPVTANSEPIFIVTGPDGAIWFTEYNLGNIGRITTGGAITEFPLPMTMVGSFPTSIVVGPDGALWFTEFSGNNNIGRITTAGAITEYPVPTATSFPLGMALGSDNALWFTESHVNQIGRAGPRIGLQFYPVTPCRLVDTRGSAAGFNGIAPFSGPSIPSGVTLTIPVQSAVEAGMDTTPTPCGTIPSTAQAYSLNVTVVPHVVSTDQFPGVVHYISMWPSGVEQPFVSTLNDSQGQILANAAIVPAGTPSGGISIYNAGPATTDVILDMNGYFAATTMQGGSTGLQFYPVAPCRLVDTRGLAAGFNGISPFSGPSLLSGATANFAVQSSSEATANTTPAPCGMIPSGAQAYSLNTTLVPHAGALDHFITLWPSGLAQPTVSTLNDQQGEVVANAAIVPAGSPLGGVSVYNQGPATADVILDLNGYFAAPSGLKFYPVSPCRLVDTRGAGAGFDGISPFSGPSIAAGAAITIPVQSAAEASANTAPAPCGTIPSIAQAYSLNLTVAPKIVLTDAFPGAIDYVTIWPAGVTQPVVSTVNDQEALVVANAAIVPAGSGSGGISVFNAGPSATDVILDMNGYFAP